MTLAPPPGRGFTLIELVVVVSIIALLAMMTIPVYLQQALQQQVKDGLVFADFVKKSVEVSYALNRARPADNAAAGLPAPEKIVGSLVTSVTVADGVVTIVYGNLAVKNIAGKRLSLQPGYVPDAPQVPLSWVCGRAKAPAGLTIAGGNGTDIPTDWLPVGCRSPG